MAEGDEIAPARVASEAPGVAQAPLHSSLIWIGLALALIGKVLSGGRPGGRPDLWILAFLFFPYAILVYWAYTRGAGRSRLFRGLRAALFAFLVIEAFYWGVSIGGVAAAVGAFMIFTRFIQPRKPGVPE